MTSFSTHHGPPLLFATVAVESFGVPVPGGTALIAFGVLARTLRTEFAEAILEGEVGSP